MTLVTLSSNATVQSWWALETLMNDLGAIIGEERKNSIDPNDRLLLEERSVTLDHKGRASDRRIRPSVGKTRTLYDAVVSQYVYRI